MPINIPIPAEGVLASYSFDDIQEKTGYVMYYAQTSRPGGTLTYHLFRTPRDCGLSGYATGASNERFFYLGGGTTVTFQTSAFNTSAVLRGTVSITFTTAQSTVTAGSGTLTATLSLNNTSLGSGTITTPSATSSVRSYHVTFSVGNTTIKKGDVLKLSFVQSPAQVCYLMHDPLDRSQPATAQIPAIDPATYSTTCKIYIPYRIDT
jgi:hypothetical protein